MFYGHMLITEAYYIKEYLSYQLIDNWSGIAHKVYVERCANQFSNSGPIERPFLNKKILERLVQAKNVMDNLKKSDWTTDIGTLFWQTL